MPHTGCKGLAVGTDSYLYVFTIVMSWSVLLDYVLLGRQQSRSMPPGLMLSARCFHILDHQTWLLKLCCSSPQPCTDACLGLCTEPVDLLSHLQHGVCMGLLGSRVVWSGTGCGVSCAAVWFWDAHSPECLEAVWLSGVSCLGTVVWLSTGTGDIGAESSAETSLLQELSQDLGKILLLLSVLLLSEPSWVIMEWFLES